MIFYSFVLFFRFSWIVVNLEIIKAMTCLPDFKKLKSCIIFENLIRLVNGVIVSR